MSEQAAAQVTVDQNALRSFEYGKVQTLYDYTKFHIGLYLTPGTLLVAAIGAKTPFSFRGYAST